MNSIEPKDRHCGDDITRRMLVLRHREDTGDRFADRCNSSSTLYRERLQDSWEHGTYWVLEILFEYLQASLADIRDPQNRHDLRMRFFKVELPDVLKSLVENRDPHEEYDSLKHLLERDWELQFMINYCLRGEVFSDTVYKEVLQLLDHFFDNGE